MTPPWGVPLSFPLYSFLSSSSSTTGAVSHILMSFRMFLSTMRLATSLEEFVMRYGVEVLGDVRIDYLCSARPEMSGYIVHCLMGVSFRPESIGVLLKVSLKDWLDDQLGCHLDDTVFDGGYSKWSLASICLGDIHSPYRLGLYVFARSSFANFSRYSCAPPPVSSMRSKVSPSTPGCSFVCFDKVVGVAQDVHPIHLVIEKIESKLRFLLGLPV